MRISAVASLYTLGMMKMQQKRQWEIGSNFMTLAHHSSIDLRTWNINGKWFDASLTASPLHIPQSNTIRMTAERSTVHYCIYWCTCITQIRFWTIQATIQKEFIFNLNKWKTYWFQSKIYDIVSCKLCTFGYKLFIP